MALGSHPSLRAFEAQERAASATAKQAGSQYFPSVSLSTSLRGTTQQATSREFVINNVKDNITRQLQSCQYNNALLSSVPTLPGTIQDCSQYAYSDEMGQKALASNRVFPFDFTKLPLR